MSREILNANQVLDKYWDGSCPIVPELIAKHVGIEVISDRSLPNKKLSGELIVEQDHSAKILVNPDDIKLRQRFTVAHELGHFFCGHNSSPRLDPEVNMTQMTNSYEEQQANNFAASLLMPEEFIRHFIFKKKITSVNRLATLLNVSSSAMRYRLKNLRLI